jgi:hypothetical protein
MIVGVYPTVTRAPTDCTGCSDLRDAISIEKRYFISGLSTRSYAFVTEAAANTW